MGKNNIHEGRIWILGDNIDTDLIVPSRVLTEQNKEALLAATLENIIPEFSSQVKNGDIIIAGTNMGCGSSREEAVYVLKELGIKAIIAKSFARIFYRNCINLGIPPIVLKDNVDSFGNLGKKGDVIKIDFKNGKIINLSNNFRANFVPFPEFIEKYLDAGGAIPYLLRNKK